MGYSNLSESDLFFGRIPTNRWLYFPEPEESSDVMCVMGGNCSSPKTVDSFKHYTVTLDVFCICANYLVPGTC